MSHRNGKGNTEATPLLIHTHLPQYDGDTKSQQHQQPPLTRPASIHNWLASARSRYPYRKHYTYQRERQSSEQNGTNAEAKGDEGFANEYLKSIVYGGLDSVISSLGIVTSVAGGQLSADVIVVLGVAKLLGDSISMATGDAMSSQAELDYNLYQREQEEKLLDANTHEEVKGLVDNYVKKGMSSKDADSMLQILSKYPDLLLDNVLSEQAGLPPPQKEHASPIKEGGVTMLSFIVFGSIPLIPYLLALIPGLHISAAVQLISSLVGAALSLFALGAFKGYLSAGSLMKNGLLMMLNGSIAGALGYVIGYLMGKLIEGRAPPGVG